MDPVRGHFGHFGSAFGNGPMVKGGRVRNADQEAVFECATRRS